jgi:hypothetical protein
MTSPRVPFTVYLAAIVLLLVVGYVAAHPAPPFPYTHGPWIIFW